jgi:6-phosphogluconolactonase (cycloisomerase 2 family)
MYETMTRLLQLVSVATLLVGLAHIPAASAAPGVLTFVEAHFDIGLDGARSVAVSPDGSHVYAAGYWDDAVAVFGRDGATGALTFVEMHQDGRDGVDGLAGARSVAVSPDGNHLYVVGSWDSAVAVFSRDGATGALTFVEVHKDTDPGVDGLFYASLVAVSPDGRHVYVASQEDGAVAVFSRDGATGALSFVEVVKDTDPGVDGLAGARSVAVSPDGSHVYAASTYDNAVAAFSRDGATGALTFVEMQQDGAGDVDGLDGAVSVAVSPDGSHVYVAGINDDAVAVFGRDGSTGALTFVEVHKDTDPGVDGLYGAWSVTVSPDGGQVYVAADTSNAVAVFSRDGSTGALTFVEREKDHVDGVDGLNGAALVAVSPDGSHVYVAGSDDDALAVFSRDGSTGALTFVQARRSVDGLDGAVSVAVSPDGFHVYVAGNDDDAVTVFLRDRWSTGALTFVEVQKVTDPGVHGLQGARSVAISPDGSHVYVMGHVDDAVAVFSRDWSSGALTFVEAHYDDTGGVDGLNGGQSVAVSPDGGHVYVAAPTDYAVAVFSRDGSTGALTFVEMQQDGDGDVDGLGGAYSVAFSPDGSHVYVAGINDDAVAVFSRDGSTGALTFVEVVKDTDIGVDGLDGANSVAVSPDGGHLYVAGRNDDAVAVFSRDGATGALTFVEVVKDTDAGVDGLNGARSVVVSPDGSRVFVAGQWDDAVAVFSRNGATGALSYVGMVKDGVGGVDGLAVADSVTVSPDGNHVYVAGYDDNAVAVFDRRSFIYLPVVMKNY